MSFLYAKKDVSLKDCSTSTNCSFYDLLESLMPHGFNTAPIHRFFTLMRKMKGKSYLCEELEIGGDIQEEHEMFTRLYDNINIRADRISVFSCDSDSDFDHISDEDILGYAIIIKVKQADKYISAYILESVVKPLTKFGISNYYFHSIKNHETSIGTENNCRKFNLEGAFFAQQSGTTHVCAHAALRVAINSHPTFGVNKLTNKYINDSIDYFTKFMPGQGLSANCLREIIEKLGFRFFQADFSKNTEIDYDRFLYPYLESGLPTILGINSWDRSTNKMNGHVLTVIGHTTNFDRWQPEADRGYGNYPVKPYITTAEWCDHYIINDDNYGMYCTIPSESMRNFIVPSKNPNPHAVIALTIAPKDISLEGYIAEQKAIMIFRRIISQGLCIRISNNWMCRLIKSFDKVVCRTILVKKNHYLSQFSEKDEIKLNFPELLWVTEISLPNLYSANKSKIGEIVLDATNSDDLEVLFAWLPEVYLQKDILNFNFGINSHIPILRNTKANMEW